MKNFLIVAVLSVATAAILTAIGRAVWSGSNAETKQRDDLNNALANYRSRREYLRNYRPLAGELAKGREVMCQFLEKLKASNDEDGARRLASVLATIDADFAKTEEWRNECLTDKRRFDDEDFTLDQVCGDDECEELAEELKEATHKVESCIKKLDSDATWWNREYTMAKIGLKLYPEG